MNNTFKFELGFEVNTGWQMRIKHRIFLLRKYVALVYKIFVCHVIFLKIAFLFQIMRENAE